MIEPRKYYCQVKGDPFSSEAKDRHQVALKISRMSYPSIRNTCFEFIYKQFPHIF